MEFKLRINAKRVSNEDLLADLRDVAGRADKPTIGQRDYIQLGKYSCKPFITRFGSWNNAIKAAGLDLTVERNITDEMLFQNLEAVWRSLERQPAYSEMQKPFSRYTVKSYLNRFGSWTEACEAFVRLKNHDLQFAKVIRRKNPSPRSISEKTRLRIFKRDSYACSICGKSPSTYHGTILHIDHIVPVSKGGDNSAENLRTLCDQCNLGRGNDQSV